MWVKEGKYWLYLSQEIGEVIEIYPIQKRIPGKQFASVYGGDKPRITYPYSTLITAEYARHLASVLTMAAAIASNWPHYQAMMKGDRPS